VTVRAQFPLAVRVQAEPFDPAAELAAFSPEGEAGAVVGFTGLCRREEGRLSALELEHYPGMVEAELVRLVGEAAGRWPLMGVTVIHRHGRIAVGETIVLVITAAAHRDAAFSAAAFLMDWLKTRAPFWKREIRADGTAGAWIEAKASDDRAAERWVSRAAE
jgi:molybdopterin synthase catalytic subunit